MAAKAILVLCAQALLIQLAFTQFHNRGPISGPFNPMSSPFAPMGAPLNPMGSPLSAMASPISQLASRNWPSKSFDPWPAKSLGCSTPAMDITATSGGGLPVTSSSAIAPTGITVVSENAYEGPLVVAGEVPFVGTTSVDGILPTAGAGATEYGCGDGDTAMVAESFAPGLPATAITPAAIGTAAISPAAKVAALNPAARFGSCGRGLRY